MKDNNKANMKDIDITEEVIIRNDLGINTIVKNDMEDYSIICQNDINSLLINGKNKMIGEYSLEIIDNKDNYSKISFSRKKDNSVYFFEYARQDDQFSLYDYSVGKKGRFLKTAQSVLDTNYIENDAKYTMIKLDDDKNSNYPLYGYENFGSRGAIMGMTNDSFRCNLPILFTIVEHIEAQNNFDIADRVFNSVAVQELEQGKTKRIK